MFRFQIAESLLGENIVGGKLQRTLNGCKELVASTRKTILDFRNYDAATGVEFVLASALVPFVDSVHSLGSVSLVRPNRGTKDLTGRGHSYDNDMTPPAVSQSRGIINVGDTKEAGNMSTEQIISLHLKHQLPRMPFLGVTEGNGYTQKFRSSASIKTSIIKPSAKFTTSGIRTRSAIDNGNTEQKTSHIHMRMSKSAREESRRSMKEMNIKALLNDVDRSFDFFEEQGPDNGTPECNDKTQAVRYHDFDIVKEITELSDEPVNIVAQLNPLSGTLPKRKQLKSTSSLSSVCASISSVSYKPSNALASGPVYITIPSGSDLSSYFPYVARFHTKKHPHETDLCRLQGIAALESGHIVVTDISHLQIMLYGPDFHYLDALACPSPCGITSVDKTTVAIALFHAHKVLLVKVHAIHLEKYKEFHVHCTENLYDIIYRPGTFYVLCRAGEVHVLDDDGKQTTLIRLHCNGLEARYLEVDIGQKRLYVSGSERVVAFDFNGLYNYCRFIDRFQF